MGEEITEVLEFTEPKFFVKRFVREKYINIESEKIMIGELPVRAIDKSLFGENLIAQIITDKYVDHLPLYRQIERFKRSGMTLSSSTLNDTVKNICNLLNPLYQCLKDEALRDKGYSGKPRRCDECQLGGSKHRSFAHYGSK